MILILVLELIVMVQTNFDSSKLKPCIVCTIVKRDCDMFDSDPSRLQDQRSDRTKLGKKK